MSRSVWLLFLLVLFLAAGWFYAGPFLRGYARREMTVHPPPAHAQDKKESPAPTVSAPGVADLQKMVQGAPKSQTGLGGGSASAQGRTPAPGSSSGESAVDRYYLARLYGIGSYYQGQLSDLLAQAYKSYLEEKSGQLHESLLELATVYLAKGEALESASDKEFYAVLDEYKATLEKDGLPLTYMERARQDYENAKEAEKDSVFAAAEKYLK